MAKIQEVNLEVIVQFHDGTFGKVLVPATLVPDGFIRWERKEQEEYLYRLAMSGAITFRSGLR